MARREQKVGNFPELAAEQCPLAPVGMLRRAEVLAARKGQFDKGLLPTAAAPECSLVAERMAVDMPLARPFERTR